mgnify:CR=1 FL=1
MEKDNIHPTAIIHPDARTAPDVRIGPYTVIGPGVVLKDNVEIMSHCHIDGNTVIGAGTRIFPGSVIGTPPQDKKYRDGDKVSLEIGEKNVFREHVMINMGTLDGGGKTVIGNGNLFMAYSHVAHDCRVGNNCVFANAATLAGHVHVDDGAVIGGLTAIHQFVRVGKYVMIGGCSRVIQDVVPFALCSDPQTRIFGVNAVGLKRAGFSSEAILNIKRAFKLLFFSGLSRPHALETIKSELTITDDLQCLIDFAQTSRRGFMTAR